MKITRSTRDIVTAWQQYLVTLGDWELLVKEVEPIRNGCGIVYELPNPIDRPDESFCLADMRKLSFTEPHYHVELEIYFVLSGSGTLFIGDEGVPLKKDSVAVIPSNISHYVINIKDLVVAAINQPPFKPENYIVLTASKPEVQFDKKQFDRLTKEL